jgi:hypothetical protein
MKHIQENQELTIIQKIENQDKTLYSIIKAEYKTTARKLIKDYDVKNMLSNIPLEDRYDNSKLIPHIDEYINKRQRFINNLLQKFN